MDSNDESQVLPGQYRELSLYDGTLVLRIATFAPFCGEAAQQTQTARGDIIFQHGLASRLDNHLALFQEWQRKGFRVIAYDVPGHGLTTGAINDYNFDDLAFIMGQVEKATREDVDRPLIVSDWSIGGLLVVRLQQNETAWQQIAAERRITGIISFTPDVAIYLLIGDKMRLRGHSYDLLLVKSSKNEI